ncbi:MAG: FMN-binding protein [Spirochaetaceae bacterium]|jgi:electron transport complex protein RnfG|nr:FMN-binding protein [Spirochaetaceae bacterium]
MKETGKILGILKLGIALTLYATAACVGLAFVYSATEKTIARRQEADLEAALRELFPGGDRFAVMPEPLVSPDPAVSFGDQYVIYRGGTVIGAAVRASGPSYGGPITALVGVDAGGLITGVKILEHSDTPGLGANAAAPNYFVDKDAGITFYGQFMGKSVRDPFEVKNDVAVITAATITSRAVTGMVKASGTAAEAWFAGGSADTGGGVSP